MCVSVVYLCYVRVCMYVCMYMYVNIIYLYYVRVCMNTHAELLCMGACMLVRMHVCMYIYVSIVYFCYVYVCMNTHAEFSANISRVSASLRCCVGLIDMPVFVCMRVCVRERERVCECVNVSV